MPAGFGRSYIARPDVVGVRMAVIRHAIGRLLIADNGNGFHVTTAAIAAIAAFAAFAAVAAVAADLYFPRFFQCCIQESRITAARTVCNRIR